MGQFFRIIKINRQGFAALEILIAMTLIILSISAVLPIIFESQSTSVSSQTDQEALYKAQAFLEKARADAKQNFNSVNSIAPIQDGIYQKSLSVNQVGSFTKQVTSTVTWKGEKNQNLSVSLNTFLTNPISAVSGGACSSVVLNPNGWKNPQHYDYPTPNLLPAPHSNGIAISDIYFYKNILYITASSVPNTSPETFYIFSVTSDATQAPVFLGKADNSSSVSTGLNAVSVSGNYAYVANAYGANFTTCSQADNCAQLQVMDVSNLGQPAVVKSFKIPGVTGSSGQSIGKSIFYSNGYIYLGLTETKSGPEFNVIDVGGGGGGASPTNPIWKGGYSVGDDVNSIFVQGNYAYIATSNDPKMIVVDISAPANPHRVGGAPSLKGDSVGQSIYSSGNNVYLGRASGDTEFYIFNASNPANVSITGSKDVGDGDKTGINSLAIRDRFAFFLTKNQFQVWDISDPSNIKPWTSDGTVNKFLSLALLGGSGTYFSCSGDYFYTAIASSQGNSKDIISVIVPGQ